jgi:hypothetical protein
MSLIATAPRLADARFNSFLGVGGGGFVIKKPFEMEFVRLK